MVYRLKIAYRGARYSGWQRQPNAVTVQELVEDALKSLLGEAVSVVGASRTDSGVHARGQIAHLVLDREFPLGGLVHGTNHHLPPDIRVLGADRMGEGFHARFCARAKEYRYRLERCDVLSPMDALFAVRVDPGIDLVAMRRATKALPGEHDFSAFALAGGTHRSSVRTVFKCEWVVEGTHLELRIEGDGFLRGMVRSLVGTVLEVGTGQREAGDLGLLLRGGERSAAGPTAPPQGLVLERVSYPHAWRPEGYKSDNGAVVH